MFGELLSGCRILTPKSWTRPCHTSDLYYYSIAGKLLGYLDTSSNTTGFYLTDTLGSVLVSFSNTDHSAAIAGNRVFGPYGNFWDVQGSFNTPEVFTGQG